MEKSVPPVSTGDILRDFLTRKMSKNSAFSLRAFARDLGVSHTYLSLVMNGKKNLSMKKVVHFTHLLQMDDKDAAQFMKAGSRDARGRAFEKLKLDSNKVKNRHTPESYFELETDRLRLLTDWYHYPIVELTHTYDFQSDPKWIGRRLDISPEQVNDALERLKRMGLLIEKNGKLVKPLANTIVQSKTPSQYIRNYHKLFIGKALQQLESGAQEDVDSRDITAVTLPIDPTRIPEARKKIAAFRRSLWRFLSHGEQTEVYQLNIQMFPLTARKSKGVVLKRGSK